MHISTAKRKKLAAAAWGLACWPKNSSSKLDSAILTDEHKMASATLDSVNLAAVQFHRYDPALPPLAAGGTVRLNWHSKAVPVRIKNDVVVAAWTFEGDVPGPIVQRRSRSPAERGPDHAA